MKAFTRFNQGKPYQAQMKPFNFMMTVLHDPFAASRFKDGLRLVGPFEPNAKKRLRMRWLNLHGGENLRLGRGPYTAKDAVGYLSYGDLITTHVHHKETKRTGPDGLPCEERARGVLGRRTVRPLRVTYIGKEADRHEERDLVADMDDLITDYGHLPGEIEERIIGPALRTFLRKAAHATGLDLENLRKIASGKRRARRDTSRRIVTALAELCAADLKALGIQPPRRHLAAIKTYRDLCMGTGSRRSEASEDPGPWNLVRFALDNIPPREIAKRAGISVTTLETIRDGAEPTASPPPALLVACVEACRSRLRKAGVAIPRSHLEVLRRYRELRGQDLRQLAVLEAELGLLKTEQRTDLHARFRYWHEVTRGWRHSMVRTRYHDATVDNPSGTRSSWTKVRSVKSILHGVCLELGENFKTFARRVCWAVQGRPRQIGELQRRIRDARERLAYGSLLPHGKE